MSFYREVSKSNVGEQGGSAPNPLSRDEQHAKFHEYSDLMTAIQDEAKVRKPLHDYVAVVSHGRTVSGHDVQGGDEVTLKACAVYLYSDQPKVMQLIEIRG